MRPEVRRGTIATILTLSLSLQGAAAVAQQSEPARYQSAYARPLSVDRGSTGLAQTLQKLHTRASLAMVTAHPDDEDGGMLTYESRGQGVDTTLLTLNRGEGGQNVMTGDYWDQLGTLRTQELLAAGNYYGVHQYWTRVADFGFSKTIEEALKTWGEDRVLYDVVRAIRIQRPLVVTSVFVGNVSDGHGHHQVAGYMAQRVYAMAADPKVFPDQIKAGLLPWSPLKVYGRVPFARVTDKGIYDYATGRYAPVRFRNYVDNTWIEGVPSTTLEIPSGNYNPMLGTSYMQLSREGLNEQKTQNGGIAVPLPRAFSTPYHRYASHVTSAAKEKTFFDGIDITLAGIASYAPQGEQESWREKLNALNATVESAISGFNAANPATSAPALARGLTQTNALLEEVAKSKLPAEARYNMTHELTVKQQQFNLALQQALGLALLANTTEGSAAPGRMGPFGDMSTQVPTSQTVVPGDKVAVAVHIANQGSDPVALSAVDVVSEAGTGFTITPKGSAAPKLAAGGTCDQTFDITVPRTAELTKPYFSRPSLEQSYYDINDLRYLNLPTRPYPLLATATVTYHDVAIKLTGVVQTVHRINGEGPVLEPLLIAPAISLSVTPYAGVVALNSAAIELHVELHSSVKGPAKGTVRLDLPAGWRSTPEVASFATMREGEDQNLIFHVQPQQVQTKPYTITAVAEFNGEKFTQGFQTVGYPGLRPYPHYRAAAYRTTGVDVKTAPNLNIGYVMGTGDDVATSLEDIGIHPNMLSAGEIASADLSHYDAIILGIRAYAARPELKTFNNRLLEYVHNGGTVVVQYQTQEYDHNYGPYPLTLSGDPEKVVEEDNKVSILAPNDPVLNWPNKITTTDFDHWVEERGHSFMREWDSHYIALTEMHDTDQDPQKGGLLYARYGKGAYVYLSYAFYRQMPDGVPGSFRIMANLLSMGKNPGLALGKDAPPAVAGTH
ncbi:PIG-L family deacetylase [Edaphobacter modestus]|uniref:LmbE family N-acetylglucosaminyl deacetylase n=1 Tax=Edaphobacter modestus TaxID=388466 RepID=A0A4Q7YW85_9BACT|nr:PIG-L family deacetylase [Edaphobacter modestus]RZU41950.1 LmbE family N-acetylglucosaminyl deacetylase [Edaphobacter modestus]